MYVIEVVGKATRANYGFSVYENEGKSKIVESAALARKFALPADAIPYAEECNGRHPSLEFNVVPYVEA